VTDGRFSIDSAKDRTIYYEVVFEPKRHLNQTTLGPGPGIFAFWADELLRTDE